VAAQLCLHVPRRGPQPAREATWALRYCPGTLRPPPHRKAEGFPTVTLWAVQVCEVAPPAEVEPIAWWLLTTVAVETTDDAIERVQWYSCRWGIEVWHRILKSGCTLKRGNSRRPSAYAVPWRSLVSWRGGFFTPPCWHARCLTRQVVSCWSLMHGRRCIVPSIGSPRHPQSRRRWAKRSPGSPSSAGLSDAAGVTAPARK
jgi:hypothetical protein